MHAALTKAARVLKHKGMTGLASAAAYRVLLTACRDIFGVPHLKKRIHGYQMYLDVNDRGISRTLLLFGTREEDHRRILSQVLKPGMTVFDIGANIGYYVLMERWFVGATGKIVAIEPSPTNAALLRRNVALNGHANIVIREGAVSDQSGTRKLLMSTRSNLNTFHTEGSAARFLSGSAIDVATTTVPALAAEFGRPDLLRMDVEGHEVEIISGLVPAVERGEMAPMILFETHRDAYTPDHDLTRPLRQLFAAGYRVPFIASSTAKGAQTIESLGYRTDGLFATDFDYRAIFADVSPEHLLHLLAGPGGVRTVLLGKA